MDKMIIKIKTRDKKNFTKKIFMGWREGQIFGGQFSWGKFFLGGNFMGGNIPESIFLMGFFREGWGGFFQ